ncbi:MAG: hypothetical protein EPO32_13350 [Anaerolineae bacterium]|nr:MAG: hypothetical protein EPO32_13350 [Anaerolineae bacterium]
MKKTSYWLALPLGLLGPAFYLVTFYLRFNRLEGQQFNESLKTFLPALLGGLFLVWLLNRAAIVKARRATWLGFLVALPFGLLGAAMGGLLGIIGIILFGAVPLVIGAGLGFLVGKMLK